MDTGKVPFGSEVWLVIKNPLYQGVCPCCNQKIKTNKNVQKLLIVEGTYCKMETDGENLNYYAEYWDSITDEYKEAWINSYYLDDIIDSPWHYDGDNYKPDSFDVYSRDIDVCDYRGEFDGTMAFHTKEEAEQFIKEYEEYL